MAELCRKVQEATDDAVAVAFVDQAYTGPTAADAAADHGIRLEVVKLTEAKRGFVLLPKRWVVERSFAWKSRFRRLVRDYEGALMSWPACISSPSPLTRAHPNPPPDARRKRGKRGKTNKHPLTHNNAGGRGRRSQPDQHERRQSAGR